MTFKLKLNDRKELPVPRAGGSEERVRGPVAGASSGGGHRGWGGARGGHFVSTLDFGLNSMAEF